MRCRNRVGMILKFRSVPGCIMAFVFPSKVINLRLIQRFFNKKTGSRILTLPDQYFKLVFQSLKPKNIFTLPENYIDGDIGGIYPLQIFAQLIGHYTIGIHPFFCCIIVTISLDYKYPGKQ